MIQTGKFLRNPSFVIRSRAAFLSLLLITVMSTSSCNVSNDASDFLLFGFTTEAAPPLAAAPGLNITSLNGGYCVHEDTANGTLQLSATLTLQPTSAVTIPLSTGNPHEVTVSPASLTFDSTNWNTPRTVTLSGVKEGKTDGNRVSSLVFGVAKSKDPQYKNLLPPSITGIILIDDDQYSIAVCPPAAGLVTTESGATDTFTVVLSRPPGANVTVPAPISVTTAADEAAVAPATLTFTPANWNLPQVVTATGQDDTLLDGDIHFEVTLPNSNSTDPNFNNLPYFSYHETLNPGAALGNLVYGINLENDVPLVTVTPLVRSFNEADPVGPANQFTVVLGVEPIGTVTIPLTNGDTNGRSTLSTTGLTFTGGACPAVGNWCTPQVVTVSPIQNNLADGTANFKIITGTATNFGNIDPADVDVTIYDDDTPGVEVVQLNRNVVESTLQNAFFRLRLTSQPTADVTIPINDVFNSGAPGLAVKPASRLGTVDKTSVTFTPANWNVYQDITFTPVNDDYADGNIQFLIELKNCISTDPKYNGLKPTPDITVNYQDNDVAGFTILANGATTNTANGAATISGFATDDMNNLSHATYSQWQMKLRSQPLADITVTLAVNTANNDGILNTTTLTFTTTNWNVYQTLFVDGASDGTNEGNLTYSVNVTNVFGDLAYADGKTGYNSPTVVARPSFSIHSCDDDVANVVTGCRRSGGFGTSEGGGTATLFFVTQSNPGGNVCVPVYSSDETEGVVTGVAGPPSVGTATITTTNWNTMVGGDTNSLTVTGQDDALFDGNVLYTLVTNAPTCGTATYTAFNPPDYSLRNTDNDQALVFSAVSNSTEGIAAPKASFQVRLQTAATADATFTVSCQAGSLECGSLNVSSVTVPVANTWQTVTINHLDDHRADGTQNHCITFGPIVSADPNIDGIVPPAACPVSNADNDKIVWVTTGLFNPNFNAGLTVADGYCVTDANKPTWGTYKALLADNTTRVATTTGLDATGQTAWILLPNTEYYLKTGTAPYTNQVFTTNAWGTFTFGTLTTPFGSATPPGHWTGLNGDWTTAANTCTNWTQNGVGGPPNETTIGAGNSSSSTSISNGVSDCNTTTTRHLICVQQ